MQKSKQKDIEDYDRTQIPHPFPINQCLENKKNLLVQMLLIVHAYFKLCLNPTALNLKVKDKMIILFDKVPIPIYFYKSWIRSIFHAITVFFK